MQTSETQVAELVRKILEEMQVSPPSEAIDGIFATIDDAVEAAVAAQKALLALTLEKRGEIIELIRARVLDSNERLSRLAVSETHLGRVEDKIRENILCCKKTPGIEDIRNNFV